MIVNLFPLLRAAGFLNPFLLQYKCHASVDRVPAPAFLCFRPNDVLFYIQLEMSKYTLALLTWGAGEVLIYIGQQEVDGRQVTTGFIPYFKHVHY